MKWAARRRAAQQNPVSSFYCIVLATLLSTLLTLLPTEVMAAMAATAISEAMSVYSMAVAPFSFFIRRRKMDSMRISKRITLLATLLHTGPPGSGAGAIRLTSTLDR